MNTLQRIVFCFTDWLTDGALTERNFLLSKNHELRIANFDQLIKTQELDAANFELAGEKMRLQDVLQVYGGRTEIDKFVSDQTKIRDLNTRIEGLERRLAKLQPRQLPGGSTTGKQMGLK